MKTWWKRLHRRWDLLRQPRRAREWFLLARAIGFAAAVPLLMRLRLPTVERLVEGRIRSRNRRQRRRPDRTEVERAVGNALALGSPLIDGRCLTRGLTLYYFLRQAGLDLKLVFGAGFGEAGFTAHCWLVKDGKPFLENSDPGRQFVTMYQIPQAPTGVA